MTAGPPIRSAMTPPASDAIAIAADRPMPSDPTIRPRSRAGYMAPQSRSWKGLLSDRLTQKTMPAATMTGGVGSTNSGSSEAAPRTRIAAIWRADRGPTRPANAPRRLAMNGAAARAARPMGSRPPRRAIVGSSDTTRARLTPAPTAPTMSRARLRPVSRRCAEGEMGLSDGLNTTYLEAPAWPAR